MSYFCKRIKFILFCFMLLGISGCSDAPATSMTGSAGTVYVNGRIYTLDDQRREVDVMAVLGEKNRVCRRAGRCTEFHSAGVSNDRPGRKNGIARFS